MRAAVIIFFKIGTAVWITMSPVATAQTGGYPASPSHGIARGRTVWVLQLTAKPLVSAAIFNMDLSLLVDVEHQPNHASYVPIIVLNRGTIAMQHFELRHRRFSPASTTRGMLPFLTAERRSTANSSCCAHSLKIRSCRATLSATKCRPT